MCRIDNGLHLGGKHATDPVEREGICNELVTFKFGFIELFVVGVLTLFGQGSKGDAVPLG